MSGRTHVQSWLTLHLVPGLGPVTCNRLLSYFGTPEKVLSAETPELAATGLLRRKSLAALSGKSRKTLQALGAREFDQAAAKDIKIIPFDDPLYPDLLKNIHDPPVVLYVLGDPGLLSCPGVGMVGSRSATRYGLDVAGRLSYSLAEQGFAVISGLALGIDSAAHRGALAAGGRTIAVLGCGPDVVYPRNNKDLYREIGSRGALVSEYPLGTLPESFRFPARNRIISGLSLGVVVVEAAKRSGSLITVRHALEQGREVFGVPGRIDSVKSGGTHTLLQQGAKLVHSVNDIIEEFPQAMLPGRAEAEDAEQEISIGELSGEEAHLFSFLDVYPRTFDELVMESGLSAQQTNELLLMLELKGMVQSLPGNSYEKVM